MRSFLVLRSVLLALGAALGLYLLTSGHVVVGVFLLAMAAVRLVMLLTMRRRIAQRRERFRARVEARQARPPGLGRRARPT